jgi:predicted helicase
VEFEQLLGKLSPDQRRRGREFERICGWYLLNAPEYRTQVRKVWLWDEWPGRWAADAGIDLVAETTEGALWAVQAKAYDPA